MRTSVVLSLTVSAVLFGARGVVAGQSDSGNSQPPRASTPSTAGGGSARSSVKVTVVKSVSIPLAARDAAKTATRQQDKGPPVPQPTIPYRTQPKTTVAISTKPNASSPRPSPPRSMPTHAPEHPSGASSQTPTVIPEGMITIEGSVAALDLNATTPTMQLRLSFGSISMLMIEPTTTVLIGNQLGKREDVQVGDAVKVLYVPKDGQHLVKSIEIEQPSRPAKHLSTEGSTADVPRPSR